MENKTTSRGAKKGMNFRVEVRNLVKGGPLFGVWGYQQDSRTMENAEKVASQVRSWGRGWEARVVAL